MNRWYRPSEIGNYFRQRIFFYALSLLFIIIISRLFYLQILKKDTLTDEAKKNAVRDLPIIPIRGNIFDNTDKLIVDNYPFYSVTVTPRDYLRDNDSLLSQILNIDIPYLDKRIGEASKYSTFLPSTLKRDITYSQLVRIEESNWQSNGINYRTETKRNYPGTANLSHAMGYLTEVSKQTIKRDPTHYQLGDLAGGAGLEKFYEDQLRGIKGHEFLMVNSTGQITGQFANGKYDIPPINGNDLYLTINDNLQAFGEELLGDRTGGIVAINPQNGEILSLISKPDYNLDVLSGLTTANAWAPLANSPEKPLYNRATLTSYPPGSTFKMLVALAALQEGIITAETKLTCNGIFYFGNRGFKCHGGRHGSIDLETAIQKSCNSYFYQLILKLDLENLYKYSRMFGMGQIPQIDINEQRPGLIPNTEYYNRVYGKHGWTKGYLVSLGIGQGEIGISPLQSAVYTSILANNGIWHQPHLVRKIYSKQTQKWIYPKMQSQAISIDSSYFAVVREGMKKVVESGTATIARVRGIVVAGKTGTSQNPHGKDHAWFVGFAPYDHPTIAICVMIENAGFGGVAAAPVAQRMINYYLNGERLPLYIPSEKNSIKLTKQDSVRFAD